MFTLLDLLEKTDKYIKIQNVSLWSFVVSSQTEIWREMDTKLKTHLTGFHTEFNFDFLYMVQFLKATSVLTLYLKFINQMF